MLSQRRFDHIKFYYEYKDSPASKTIMELLEIIEQQQKEIEGVKKREIIQPLNKSR